MRPFLKWAGGKYRLLNRIVPLLPEGNRLVEPFVGSGSVFLNTDYEDYLCCDSNADLISLYTQLQDEGEQFIAYARAFFTPENNQKEKYLEWRHVFNSTSHTRLKAALFLYLNRHGFNGLCRYNQSGGFNVPFGSYAKPYFPEEELLSFLNKLKNAQVEFKTQSFEKTFSDVQAGDVIYCDPPYVALSSTANFTSYATNSFGENQQQDLAQLANNASKNNIPVIISNHHTPLTVALYRHAQIQTFDVQRSISCIGDKRNKASELLALFA